MDNKHNIDQLFKSVVEHYELKPSSDIWNRIEEELDQTKTTHTYAHFMRYAALLLVFISVVLFSVPTSKNTIQPQLAGFTGNNSNTVVENAVALANNVINGQDNSTSISTLKTNTTNTPFETDKVNVFASATLPENNSASDFIFYPQDVTDPALFAANRDIFERIYNTDDAIDMMGYTSLSTGGFGNAPSGLLADLDAVAAYKDYTLKGVYFGISGSYNQTSLLEYENVFKGERPIQPSLKFGTSKGLLFGYNFSNKFGIEGEFIYNATLGQNYVMSEDEEIVEKSLSLSYDLIPIVAKIKVGRISSVTNLPVILNYTAGIQYGQLREARLPQDKRYEETDEELFKENDLSVVLGLEYDIFVQDNLMLTLGTRGSISTDVSTHNAPFNGYAKRNFVFGARAALSYTFN